MDEDKLYRLARGFIEAGASLSEHVETEEEYHKEAMSIVSDLREIYEAGVRDGVERS